MNSNANAKPYEFKVGDKGKLKGSTMEYEVIAVLDEGKVPDAQRLVVLVRTDAGYVYYTDRDIYGKALSLVSLIPPTRTVYINLYEARISNWWSEYSSEEEARRAAAGNAYAVAVPVTIQG